MPLVQMDPMGPKGISLAAIAAGKYDAVPELVRRGGQGLHHPVIMSFAHEMNGSWYSWGYTKGPSPKTFVAAWRHVVTLFRALGAKNVTWLWTVNIINDTHGSTNIPSPGPWWPGSAYVNWVGIDGYYLKPTWQFAPLVRADHRRRAETDHRPDTHRRDRRVASSRPASEDRRPCSRASTHYGLLGFVWFNSVNSHGVDFRVDSSAAEAAFRKGASTYKRPGS